MFDEVAGDRGHEPLLMNVARLNSLGRGIGARYTHSWALPAPSRPVFFTQQSKIVAFYSTLNQFAFTKHSAVTSAAQGECLDVVAVVSIS